jgi:CheY-like chemotaxis protein
MSRRRALVADDNHANQRLAAALLEAAGLEAELVPNGQDAVQAASEKLFELILMDINMPVLDGLAAIRSIREDEKRRGRQRTPIYVVSSQCEAGDIRQSLEAGADGHLGKPLEVSRFMGLVGSALRAVA